MRLLKISALPVELILLFHLPGLIRIDPEFGKDMGAGFH